MAIKKQTKTKADVAAVRPEADQLTLIRQLADILNETGLTEIELDQKGARVRVSKHQAVQAAPTQHALQASTVSAAPSAPPTVLAPANNPDSVKSPMVGTCYLASSPEAAPFVNVGSNIKQGQTILIIEAMKTMNQIVATKSGKVTQIFVTNGQPVEFGEALMVIE